MSQSASGGMAPARRRGDRAVTEIIPRVDGLRHVPDKEAEHYDVEAERAIFPTEAVTFVGICVLGAGSIIEVKSCIPRLTSGQRGKFYLRRGQHEQLVEEGGYYLFAVVSPHDREPIAMIAVAATTVDDVIPSWRDGGDGRQDCSQISWSRIFDVQEVTG